VNAGLVAITTALALITAAGALVPMIRDQPPGWILVGALAALELVLLVVCVVGLVQVATTDRDIATGTIAAYLLAMLVLAPAATLWSFVERTRFGTAIILIACLAVPAMTARALQLWNAGGHAQ
jgi:hypothetical protein